MIPAAVLELLAKQGLLAPNPPPQGLLTKVSGKVVKQDEQKPVKQPIYTIGVRG